MTDEPNLLITEAEWNNRIPAIVSRMRDYISQYRCPIIKHKTDEEGEFGELLGSGSFIELHGRVFILTNYHVSKQSEADSLAFMMKGSDNIFKLSKESVFLDYPFDLSLILINSQIWENRPPETNCIPIEKFLDIEDPLEHELFAFTGFPGASSKFLHEKLYIKGFCYTARIISLPTDERVDPDYHIGLEWNPEKATSVDMVKEVLPSPKGMSGSTLWNTRFVESLHKGIEWSPSQADVSGIIWGWPSNKNLLISTKVKYIDRLFNLVKE